MSLVPGLSTPITLMVGLANPGDEYLDTRHNAGSWFIGLLARHYQTSLRLEKKLKGFHAVVEDCHLFIPSTFMNHSGQAVKAISDFYKIAPENMLIAHDELDLAPGDIRLKYAGGHGGHNGLRDIIAHLHTHDFHRLRIGIGHPGPGLSHLVSDYVLSRPNRSDQELISDACDRASAVVPFLLKGQIEKAMQQLHTRET